MKKAIIILLSMIILMNSCAKTAVTQSLLKLEAVADTFLQAISSGDVETCLSLMADDIAFRQEPAGLSFEGKEQVKGILIFMTGWNYDWSVTNPYEIDGNRVTFSTNIHSNHYKLFGIELMRARLEFLVQDGKLVSFTIIENEEDTAALDKLTRGNIGVQLELQAREGAEKGIKVLEVIKNSPAQQAGISAGDLIVAINGINCSQMTRPLEAQLRTMGPVGSQVRLIVTREGTTMPIDMEVTRVDLSRPQ